MAQVNGLSVARMLEIEGSSVVGGDVVDDNLILTQRDGTEINAGSVRGAKGDPGDDGADGTMEDVSRPWSSSESYEVGDVVGYTGRLWKAKAAQINKPPYFNTDVWASVTGGSVDDWNERDPYFDGTSYAESHEVYWGSGTRSQALTSVAGEFETGTQALKLTLAAGADSWIFSNEENVVKDGDKIQIQVRARLLAASPGLTVRAGLAQTPPTSNPGPFSPGNAWAPVSEPNSPMTTEWATYTFTATAVAGKPRARAYVIFDTLDVAADVCVDWIEVKRLKANVDLLARQMALSQFNLTGGGRRKVSPVGISWSERFIVMGMGRSSDFATSGFFDITMPANGTVIPVLGTIGATTSTVASGVIPLNGWQTLYYKLPVGNSFDFKPGNFVIVDFTYGMPELPGNLLRICGRSQDTGSPAYSWGDGVRQDYWKDLTLKASWVPYNTVNWKAPAWRFLADGQIGTRGLMKTGLVGGSNYFATLDSSLGPDSDSGDPGSGTMFSSAASGGTANIYVLASGNLLVSAIHSPATNAYVSLDRISWFPKGT